MPNLIKQQRIFSNTQIFFICFGLLSHLIIFVTIFNFSQTGYWGSTRLNWIITNRLLDLGLFQISSNTLISIHVLTSYCLYFGLLLQICLMSFAPRKQITIALHRAIGSIIVCLALPAFVVPALLLQTYLIKNPLSQVLFSVIPLIVCYGLVSAVCAIRSGNAAKHVDGVFVAVILLNAPSIFRIATAALYLTGTPVDLLIIDNEPNPLLAMIRTVIIIVILTISFISTGRLRQNWIPILLLAAALGYSTFVYSDN